MRPKERVFIHYAVFVFHSSFTSYNNHSLWTEIFWHKAVHVTKRGLYRQRAGFTAQQFSKWGAQDPFRGPGGQNYFRHDTRQMIICLFHSHSFNLGAFQRPHHVWSLNRLQKQTRESRYLLLSQKWENFKNIQQQHSFHQTYLIF